MTDRVRWGAGRQELFKEYLYDDLQRTIDARGPLEASWRKDLELYRAPEPKGLRRFPFEGASNTTFPLVAMNVDPIVARLMRTIHAPQNLWTVTAINEQWVDVAKPTQDFLQFVDAAFLRMHDVNYRTLLETVKLGTGVYKAGWRYESHDVMGYDETMRRMRLSET